MAAGLLLLTGCAKEPAGGGEGLRMLVVPSVAGETKGSLTTESMTDFYLRVVSGDPAYSYFVHLSKDGSSGWMSPTQLLWKNASASVDYAAARFGAYAFKAADFASGVSVALTVPADQSTQERLDAADLLTAPTASKAFSATAAGAPGTPPRTDLTGTEARSTAPPEASAFTGLGTSKSYAVPRTPSTLPAKAATAPNRTCSKSNFFMIFRSAC